MAKVAKLSAKTLKGENGFLGHKRFELKNAFFQSVRNKPANIQRGSYSVGKNSGTMAYYDSANDVTVILNTEGRVITVSYGDI